MSEQRNVQVVQEAYAAFGRGDVEGILATLDPRQLRWDAVKGLEGIAPHAGLRTSLDGVRDFFTKLAGTLEFQKFEPREFIAQGDAVVVLGYYDGTVKSTGARFGCDWVMVFKLKDGRIQSFQEWTDSAQLARAYGVGV